jgi:hypothetical protein
MPLDFHNFHEYPDIIWFTVESCIAVSWFVGYITSEVGKFQMKYGGMSVI